MAKLFTFDLHGVLEKGNEETVLKISNIALESLSYKKRFTMEDIDFLYGEFWINYFRHLLPDLRELEYKSLQNKCHEIAMLNPKIIKDNTQPNDHAYFVLEEIKKRGHSQIVISRISNGGLEFFLSSIDMSGYFPKGSYFAVGDNKDDSFVTKNDILRNFLDIRKEGFDDIIIVGDSDSDMALKSVAGGTTYLYLHPWRKPKKCEADHHIRDLRDILKEIN